MLVHEDINHFPLPEFAQYYFQVTSINLRHIGLTQSALYCSPRHNICKDQLVDYFNALGPKFIASGDNNANHILRITSNPSERRAIGGSSYQTVWMF